MVKEYSRIIHYTYTYVIPISRNTETEKNFGLHDSCMTPHWLLTETQDLIDNSLLQLRVAFAQLLLRVSVWFISMLSILGAGSYFSIYIYIYNFISYNLFRIS